MSSSRNKVSAFALAALLGMAMLLSGCIADTAADSDLPWASDQGWENMMLMPGGMMDRYD
jgi:Spy/CpxP family protein refolding chaperone